MTPNRSMPRSKNYETRISDAGGGPRFWCDIFGRNEATRRMYGVDDADKVKRPIATGQALLARR